MNGFDDFYNDINPSDSFQELLNPNSILDSVSRIRPDKEANKMSVKSDEEADQALAAAASYLATEGSKTLNSSMVALLVKSLTDARTLMSSGDSSSGTTDEDQSQNADAQKKEVAMNDTQVPTSSESDTKDSPVKMQTTPETPEPVPDIKLDIDEDRVRELVAAVERNLTLPSYTQKLDIEQQKYFKRLRRSIKSFKSFKELMDFLIDYAASDDKRPLYPEMLVFILIIFFSNHPDMYMGVFVLNPLSYYSNYMKKQRSYAYDDIISALEAKE